MTFELTFSFPIDWYLLGVFFESKKDGRRIQQEAPINELLLSCSCHFLFLSLASPFPRTAPYKQIFLVYNYSCQWSAYHFDNLLLFLWLLKRNGFDDVSCHGATATSFLRFKHTATSWSVGNDSPQRYGLSGCTVLPTFLGYHVASLAARIFRGLIVMKLIGKSLNWFSPNI